MDKALLKDIKKKLFIRSSLISLNSLEDILGLNEGLSSDEILLEIITKTLREYELTYPLILEMKINKGASIPECYDREGWIELKQNFKLYLEGRISEDQIVLIPNSMPRWRHINSWPTANAYMYFTEYKRPYLFVGDIPFNDRFYLRGICSRPIIPDFLPDKSFNPDSERSAIYWLNIEDGGLESVFFIDLCMVNLLDFIRQLKASVQLPGISVDVLGNVDSAYQELRARCDQFILQSGWSGDLVI